MRLTLILIYCMIVSYVNATTYYISSSTGDDHNNGTSPSTAWRTIPLRKAGNTYLLKRGDIFYTRITTQTTATSSSRVTMGAYGTGANPILSNYTTIKPTSWIPAGPTNVWRAATTVAANVTGYLPTGCNVGQINVDGVIHGVRRASKAGLSGQWQFYCDFTSTIYVYSVGNPNTHGTIIKVSNGGSDKIFRMGSYETIENIWLIGSAGEGIQAIMGVNDTIRYCRIREIGGEMKSSSDSTRQGAVISFYNGGTNNYAGHDTIEQCYEDAQTMQKHGTTKTIAFTNCIFEYNLIDSCENGFNGTIQIAGTEGYFGCKVRNCTIKNPGYGWAHPPAGNKPMNNMSVAFMSNFWQQKSGFDLVFENNTIINPHDGLHFVTGTTDSLPYISRNNEIYIDSLTLIRRNCAVCTNNKWTWKYVDTVAFRAASKAEIGSHFHCLDCAVVGTHTYYADADSDGFGDPNVSITASTQPAGYVNNNTDCNDALAAVNPNTIWRLDADNDGYYFNTVMQCVSPGATWYRTGHALGIDCNDNNSAINPGATEICDGIDNNCSGFIDENVKTTFYFDSDGDGYGDATKTTQACSAPDGYVSNKTDCNDAVFAINPSHVEVCGDSLDNNCNGLIDEGCGAPTVSLADTTVAETVGTAKVRVFLSHTTTAAVSLTLSYANSSAITPADYKPLMWSISIPAGSTTGFIDVTIINDGITEPEQLFYVKIKTVINAILLDGTAVVKISAN